MHRYLASTVILIGLATPTLADVAGDERDLERLTADIQTAVAVRLYGDTAVLTGRSGLVSDDATGTLQGETRGTRIFMRQGGKWKLVAFQATLVRKK